LRAFTQIVSSQLRRSGRAFVLTALALLTLFALAAASATGAENGHRGPPCTSGASSVRARIVDGRVVASTPATSGCIHR
jgi:hypothetical protein